MGWVDILGAVGVVVVGIPFALVIVWANIKKEHEQ